MARDVVLLHGLWMPGLVMSPLAARIANAGFRTHVFAYPSRERPFDAQPDRLLRFVRERVADAPAHFVAHSLGGRVVLEAFRREPAAAPASIVLLGTPAGGCLAGRRLSRHGWGSWMLGESEPVWRNAGPATWTRAEPLGVIAGSRPLGLGRVLGRLPGVNDGVVTLDETAVQGMRERIVVPVAHSAMLVSSRVAHQVVCFLRDGKFDAAAL